ncbi:MAG: ABC transporter substrate-binding protein [Burkholderiaceae bacterium]|jgi:NitT/TauT family transport system substrate-binding protein
MRFEARAILTACAFLVSSFLAQPAWPQTKDKVTLMLNWYVYSEHAPFFLGKEKGYFAEQGIDLEIQEGRGSGPTVQAVAAKSVDFGYADLPTMIKIVAKGAPVIATGVLLQVSPMAVISFSQANIRQPRDLIGKTVALTPGDSPSQIWPLFLKKTGLDESQFKTVSGDAQTKLNAVITGRADALPGYVMDQGIKLQEATGKPVNAIHFADYGIDLVSSGIVANRELVSRNPGLVKRFMAAATRSAEEAEKNPEAAVAALLKAYPKSGSHDLLLSGIQQTVALYHNPADPPGRVFRVNLKHVEQSLDVLVEYGGLDPATRGKAGDYVTLDYLP